MDDLKPAWNPTRQCTATNRRGERCGRQPIPGGQVCVLHGGAAPQVRQSARKRLLEGADLAIDHLLKLLTPKPACPHCLRSDHDRDPAVVRACQLVLDRAGFHPTLAIEQAHNEHRPLADLSNDELTDHLEALVEQARALRDSPALPEPSVEAEVTAIQETEVQVPLATETPDEGIGD